MRNSGRLFIPSGPLKAQSGKACLAGIALSRCLIANYFLYAFDLLFYLGDAAELQVRVVFKSMFTLALNLPSIAILALC